jgi:hypothetical protein
VQWLAGCRPTPLSGDGTLPKRVRAVDTPVGSVSLRIQQLEMLIWTFGPGLFAWAAPVPIMTFGWWVVMCELVCTLSMASIARQTTPHATCRLLCCCASCLQASLGIGSRRIAFASAVVEAGPPLLLFHRLFCASALVGNLLSPPCQRVAESLCLFPRAQSISSPNVLCMRGMREAMNAIIACWGAPCGMFKGPDRGRCGSHYMTAWCATPPPASLYLMLPLRMLSYSCANRKNCTAAIWPHRQACPSGSWGCVPCTQGLLHAGVLLLAVKAAAQAWFLCAGLCFTDCYTCLDELDWELGASWGVSRCLRGAPSESGVAAVCVDVCVAMGGSVLPSCLTLTCGCGAFGRRLCNLPRLGPHGIPQRKE